MSDTTEQALLARIDADRAEIVQFLQDFLRERTPNPPGDTRGAAAFIRRFLDAHGLPHRVVSPHPEMPNIVGTWEGGLPGRHLVLNGHIDVFPVDPDDPRWIVDPWNGDIRGDKIYGRGACDMKAGTTASIFTYAYLYPLRDRLRGKLTLTCVSDEETFGPWGARYLIENEPEVLGDCVLNGEPSSSFTIRFAEKGNLWLRLQVETTGAHGAYIHATRSASKIAMEIAHRLEAVCDIRTPLPNALAKAVADAHEATDIAMGEGAADTVPRITLNVGQIHSGLKVNMIPGFADMELDFRLPPGTTRETVWQKITDILADYPDARLHEIGHAAPSHCDPNGEMVEILQDTVEALQGHRPVPVVSLGGTDARLWRWRNIPAYVYGPFPHGMGGANEHVDVEEFLHIVRTHILAAYRYLSREA
ncbi:M20/M25/M40 family metallo-hydrolase [Rhodobaculum claviforme]|uniref:Peptidase n=1 Tax=Rhodobaculum claviforme TaxID=1549854 RepID=A0A934TP37_9RHOB|nr:M20/M25/M40 family metallo-hydrolase [Rhodobaculum claviforme]MBK5928638.1 peptidase [Rhodobaculum claviforme]